MQMHIYISSYTFSCISLRFRWNAIGDWRQVMMSEHPLLLSTSLSEFYSLLPPMECCCLLWHFLRCASSLSLYFLWWLLVFQSSEESVELFFEIVLFAMLCYCYPIPSKVNVQQNTFNDVGVSLGSRRNHGERLMKNLSQFFSHFFHISFLS